MTNSYFKSLEQLDRLIEREPYSLDIYKDLKPLLVDPSLRKYFYDTLPPNKGWLDVLRNVGEFENPPPVEKNEKDSTLSLPLWPASRYLVNVADIEPKSVSEIIINIPDTENPRVHEDIIDAALRLPTPYAENIVPKALKWIDSAYKNWFFAEKFSKLILKLIEDKRIKPALEISKKLFSLVKDPREQKVRSLGFPPDPQAKFDKWEYREILKEMVPNLAKFAGIDALYLFCELLNKATKIYPDKSHLSPLAIEDHEQNKHADDPWDLLIFAVRDIGQILIEQEGKEVLSVIESFKSDIFKRIGLHIRRFNFDVDPEGTNKIIKDRGNLKNISLHHELFHLLENYFENLDPETKLAYFDYAENGYDVSEYIKYYKEMNKDQVPTEDEIDREKRRHEFDAFLPIKKFLEGDIKKRFLKLSNEFKASDHPDFHLYFGPAEWKHPSPPKKLNELKEMELDALIEYLEKYEPTDYRDDETVEGLGISVSKLVSENPDKYAPNAESFKIQKPEYVEGLLSGIRESIKKDFKLEYWKPVLELCKWVVEQERDMPLRRGRHSRQDPGWGWTRMEITRLLDEGFSSDNYEFPFELQQQIWEVLKPLTEDQKPDKDQESEDSFDYYTQAINAVRSRAIEEVVKYALWIYRFKEKERSKIDVLSDYPEIQEVLYKHLSDKSLAVHSVYGRWFPWLKMISKKWAFKNKSFIFPCKENELKRFMAAWSAFISYTRPYNDIFKIIKDKYDYAVEHIEELSKQDSSIAKPINKLAEHLMNLFYVEQIELDDPLIETFFNVAPDEVRKHSLIFLSGAIPQDLDKKKGLNSRLKRLWEFRLKKAKEDKTRSYKNEMSAFFDWFNFAELEEEWFIDNLQEALLICEDLDYLPDIFDKLYELTSKFPVQVIKCLELLIENEKQGWFLSANNEKIKNILQLYVELDNGEARQAAIALVNKLGEIGWYKEYRDIFNKLDRK